MTIDEQIADAEQHLQRVHDSLRARRELVKLSGREIADAEFNLAALRAEQAAAASAPAKSYGEAEAEKLISRGYDDNIVKFTFPREFQKPLHEPHFTLRGSIDSTAEIMRAAFAAALDAAFSAGSAATLAKCEEAVRNIPNRWGWPITWVEPVVAAIRAAATGSSSPPVDRVAEAVAAEREACAKLAEGVIQPAETNAFYMQAATFAAFLIRARSKGGAA